MQFLELPLDIFKIVIAFTVQDLGLKQSMKARLICRTFADEILDAVIETRVIEEVKDRTMKFKVRLDHHHSVIARYLYHRVRTDGPVTHSWITTIRETCRLLAQHKNSENDPARVELLERSACICLAMREGSFVFEKLSEEEVDSSAESEARRTLVNSLALAAWMGDKTLVESLKDSPDWLDPDSDPESFFGRPSWAAAAQGHAEIVQFFLDQGASPYQPGFSEAPSFELSNTPLGVASYMGHENITQLYLQPPYYRAEVRLELRSAVFYAAEGNQPTTLKYILEHYKETSAPHDFLYAIDGALVASCRRGAPLSVRILLEYGADANESDTIPHSCLQLAAIAGDAQIVKMLLDAGASLEPDSWRHRRTSTLRQRGRRQPSALMEASRRGNYAIIKLITDKQQELDGGESQGSTVLTH